MLEKNRKGEKGKIRKLLQCITHALTHTHTCSKTSTVNTGSTANSRQAQTKE